MQPSSLPFRIVRCNLQSPLKVSRMLRRLTAVSTAIEALPWTLGTRLQCCHVAQLIIAPLLFFFGGKTIILGFSRSLFSIVWNFLSFLESWEYFVSFILINQFAPTRHSTPVLSDVDRCHQETTP